MTCCIAFAAFLDPLDCDAFVEANKPHTDSDYQCVIIDPAEPLMRPRALLEKNRDASSRPGG